MLYVDSTMDDAVTVVNTAVPGTVSAVTQKSPNLLEVKVINIFKSLPKK